VEIGVKPIYSYKSMGISEIENVDCRNEEHDLSTLVTIIPRTSEKVFIVH
jgi:hypothetical protein